MKRHAHDKQSKTRRRFGRIQTELNSTLLRVCTAICRHLSIARRRPLGQRLLCAGDAAGRGLGPCPLFPEQNARARARVCESTARVLPRLMCVSACESGPGLQGAHRVRHWRRGNWTRYGRRFGPPATPARGDVFGHVNWHMGRDRDARERGRERLRGDREDAARGREGPRLPGRRPARPVQARAQSTNRPKTQCAPFEG